MMFPLILTLFIAFPISIILDKRTGRILPACMFILSVLEYVGMEYGGFFDFISLLSVFSCFLWLIAVILVRSERRLAQKAIHNFFCPSLLLFIVFYFYLFLVTSNRSINSIDDFTIWGWRVKEAYQAGRLYFDSSYFVRSGNTPLRPFSTMLLVMFNHLFGAYKESTSLFAHNIFCFTALLIFYDRYNWKSEDLPGLMLSPLLMIVLMLTLGSNEFNDENCFVLNTTYPDWILSLLLANSFLQMLDSRIERGDLFLFGTTIAMMLLTDRIGFAFALLSSSAMIVRCFMYAGKNLQKKLPEILFFTILFPIVIYSFWRMHVFSFNPTAWKHFFIYDPGNKIQSILDPIRLSIQTSVKNRISGLGPTNYSPLNDTQKFVLSYFFKTLASEPLITHPIKLTYLSLIFLTSLSLFITCIFNRQRIDIHVIALFYFLGALAYAFTIGMSYALFFSEYEAIRLAQFGRYMQNYTLFGMIIAFLVPLSIVKDGRWCILGFFLSLLFIEPSSIKTVIYQKDPYIYMEKEREVIQEYLETAYEGENILIVVQNEQKDFYILRYLFGEYWDRITRFYSYHPGEDIDRFIWHLKRNQYVLIANSNDEFANELWSKVCDDYPCMNMILYKISVGGDNRVYFEMGYNFEYMVENGLSFSEYLESY